MGSPVRLRQIWTGKTSSVSSGYVGGPVKTTVYHDHFLTLTVHVHGVTLAGGSIDHKPARAWRDAVRMLREAAWKVIGERQPPDVVDLGDAFPFPAVSTAYKRGRRRWHRITEARADHLLEAVPPRYVRGFPGFLMGEPATHVEIDGREVAVHAAVVKVAGSYYCREVAAHPAALAAALAELHGVIAPAVRADGYARQYLGGGGAPDVVDLGALRAALAGCALPPRPEWMPEIAAAVARLAPEYQEAAQLERANDASGAAVGAAGEWLTDVTDPTG